MGGASMGKKCIKDICREPEGMRSIGYLSVDEKILKLILQKKDGIARTTPIWLKIGTSGVLW
jgi:hypothetical protein